MMSLKLELSMLRVEMLLYNLRSVQSQFSYSLNVLILWMRDASFCFFPTEKNPRIQAKLNSDEGCFVQIGRHDIIPIEVFFLSFIG
mmetsp:Transcript_534/g.869  ORF Transcript_534/g.869 Transcript_534/m.869 type:complete len:86 (-) Transcript_534:258-515(-)